MYIPKYRDFQQEIILCDWDEDLTPVSIILPDPPNLDKVGNVHLPKDEQMWQIPDLKERRSWMKTLSNYEADKFEDQEIERSFETGYWFLNNGRLEYLTPLHYFYLQWWNIGAIGTGYPQLRIRDRNYFYFWEYQVCRSQTILGMNYMKHRREGATSRAQCTNYHTIIQGENLHGGIQSKTGDDAKKVFLQHLVKPWKMLPEFFRPIWDGTTNPKEALIFNDPAERVTAKNTHRGKETEALGSWIDWEDGGESAYDSTELNFYHNDECGKTVKFNIYSRWKDYAKKCLVKGIFKVGNSLHTSTVAEMEREGGENFARQWEESDMDTMVNGTTTSGLINYFCPAFDGFEGFVDRYGYSIIDAPDKEQLAYLRKTYPKFPYKEGEGAKAFLENIRESLKKEGKWEELAAEKRMNPFSVKEGFRASGEDCSFNKEKITIRIEETEHKANLWLRGNLEWVPMYNPMTGETRTKDTYVVFVPSSNGRFYFHAKWYDAHNPLFNKTKKTYDGLMEPVNNHVFASGIDSYDHVVVKGKKPSKGACTVLYKHDVNVDPLNKPLYLWETNKQVIRYCERPTGGPNVFYEDMIMLHFLLGSETLIETNKIGCYNYFMQRGYELFVANRPESTWGATKSTQDSNEQGVAGSTLMKNAEFEAIDQYIETYYELMDDPILLQDLLAAQILKLTKYDLTVAFGLTLLLARKKVRFDRQFDSNFVLFNRYNKSGHVIKKA